MVYQMHWTAGMLTRPAGHEAKAEAEARHVREQLSVMSMKTKILAFRT